MSYGYVLELKYLKRSKSLDESVVADKVQEAVASIALLLGRSVVAASLSVSAAYRLGGGVSRLGVGRLRSGG